MNEQEMTNTEQLENQGTVLLLLVMTFLTKYLGTRDQICGTTIKSC